MDLMIEIFSRPAVYLGFAIGMTLSRLIRQWNQMTDDWRISVILALISLLIGTALVIHKKESTIGR